MKAFRLTGILRCIMAYLFPCLPSGLTRAMLKTILHFRKKITALILKQTENFLL
ncbi:hypothetical protein [Acidithiobacillus ferrivorans]|uniref:hypothetical protein n=1 Tax=Acidithiobacillus ferrivorans TaxID=160808 RepID=UPI001C07E71A|nr:hypothetical protein [Acidithiobacillus ferrivorans]MBU2851338.1 hypothetical protein [Acidithiobacillus ferrivorans]